MRFTSSLLSKRVLSPPPTSQPPTPPWPSLHHLKADELRHIARQTGLPSTGLKSALIASLEEGLAQRKRDDDALRRKPRETQKLSILSIDMGIKNLAFAHLLCAEPLSLWSDGREHSSSVLHAMTNEKQGMQPRLVLNAWRRISLPLDRELAPGEFPAHLDALGASPAARLPGGESELESESADADDLDLDADVEAGVETPKNGKSRPERATKTKTKTKTRHPPFSLRVYASHAHEVISTLLEKYNPTHVLIERQRFRSMGGAAVQEWSLRVGVLEGMLWAVLHSLRMQRQRQRQQQQQEKEKGLHLLLRDRALTTEMENASADAGAEQLAPKVLAIDPARVGRFWLPSESGSLVPCSSDFDTTAAVAATDPKPESRSKSKSKLKAGLSTDSTRSSSADGKKRKINLVGSWLESGAFELGDHGVLPWVEAYLARWGRMNRSKSKSTSTSKSTSKSKSKESEPEPEPEPGSGSGSVSVSVSKATAGVVADLAKLDDLADCLVQGVTWLEWERMKGKFLRDWDELK